MSHRPSPDPVDRDGRSRLRRWLDELRAAAAADAEGYRPPRLRDYPVARIR